MFSLTSSICFLFAILFCLLNVVLCAKENIPKDFPTAFSECKDLKISQDGPVTLDVPIVFEAELSCTFEDEVYAFIFEDNVDPPHEIKLFGNRSASTSVVYPETLYKPGKYAMTVSAYLVVLNSVYIKVASNNVSFTVTEYIPGILNISGVSKKYDKLYVSTGQTVNMTIELEYPARVIEHSEMSYSWTIDEDQFITMQPFNSYTFLHPGTYNIHVAVVARIPLYDNNHRQPREVKYKWGYFNQELTVKDPFYFINLTGNTYLQHGQLFNMNVSCNGSGPFEYCWKVYQPSENMTNLTCVSPVITTRCSFPIIYYFHQPGDYRVMIHIDNFVSAVQRKIEAHVYDVSRRAQLSTVIIPLFCSVLVIFIIAAGVMLHVRRNQQFDIETADFDFLQSDTCVMETFWERLYHSVLQAIWIGRRLSTTPYLCLTNTERSNSRTQYDSVAP